MIRPAQPLRIGIVGCGNISPAYFRAGRLFREFRIAACADRLFERARARAREFGVPKAYGSVQELVADPDLDLVLNLTTPQAHAQVGLAALAAGKHLYNEKPLATGLADARRMLTLARKNRLRIGCAPDTFLGTGLSTCRRLIDQGAIGKPVAATAFMLCRGHERWHPDPAFHYKAGGGPMFDMGPYYLTALTSLLGPVRRVTGCSRISFPTRIITSKPRFGRKIRVEVPTHVAGILEFASGAVATLVTSFDVWPTGLPPIEIYGTDGTLRCPDPNGFEGPVLLRDAKSARLRDIPLLRRKLANQRGLGIADLAAALRDRRPHRASGDLAFHVLEVMHAVHSAAHSGRRIDLRSACKRPEPLTRSKP